MIGVVFNSKKGITFKNIKELEKYMGSENGTQMMFTDSQIKKILREEARRLENYLKYELEKYFESYDPVEYTRTGYTVQSIRVGQPQKYGNYLWGIEIYFDDGLANHPSYIAQDQPDGYTPWLLEVGWNIENKVGFSRPMFTKHPGTGYITKAIERFNKNNKYGFKIEVKGGWS